MNSDSHFTNSFGSGLDGVSGTTVLQATPPLGFLLLPLALLLFFSTWIVGGVESATIILAVLIGGLAIFKPRTALWASTAFIVYAFVFFPPLASALDVPGVPPQFFYWAAGVAIITAGLFIAWLIGRFRRLKSSSASSSKPVAVLRLNRIIFMMAGVCLIASLYGLLRGNGSFAVARQLFGCLLVPCYYLFASRFLHTPEQVHQWLKRVSLVVTLGAACCSVGILLTSISLGRYEQQRSPITFLIGAIAAAQVVEFLWEKDIKKRLSIGASFFVCVAAILLTGARFVAASVVGTTMIILILRQRKRGMLTMLAMFAVLLLAVGYVIVNMNTLAERGGILGGIAARFSPDVTEDESYISRLYQAETVLETLREHPILGAGMGAEISIFVPEHPDIAGSEAQAYVDNGWGFLLLKMGLLGLLIFLMLLWRFLGFAARNWPFGFPDKRQRVQGCLLAILLYALLGFIGGPTFFQFLHSGFVATDLGALAVLAGFTNQRSERLNFRLRRS